MDLIAVSFQQLLLFDSYISIDMDINIYDDPFEDVHIDEIL